MDSFVEFQLVALVLLEKALSLLERNVLAIYELSGVMVDVGDESGSMVVLLQNLPTDDPLLVLVMELLPLVRGCQRVVGLVAHLLLDLVYLPTDGVDSRLEGALRELFLEFLLSLLVYAVLAAGASGVGGVLGPTPVPHLELDLVDHSAHGVYSGLESALVLFILLLLVLTPLSELPLLLHEHLALLVLFGAEVNVGVAALLSQPSLGGLPAGHIALGETLGGLDTVGTADPPLFGTAGLVGTTHPVLTAPSQIGLGIVSTQLTFVLLPDLGQSLLVESVVDVAPTLPILP